MQNHIFDCKRNRRVHCGKLVRNFLGLTKIEQMPLQGGLILGRVRFVWAPSSSTNGQKTEADVPATHIRHLFEQIRRDLLYQFIQSSQRVCSFFDFIHPSQSCVIGGASLRLVCQRACTTANPSPSRPPPRKHSVPRTISRNTWLTVNCGKNETMKVVLDSCFR
jgi:hypothetical protein